MRILNHDKKETNSTNTGGANLNRPETDSILFFDLPAMFLDELHKESGIPTPLSF